MIVRQRIGTDTTISNPPATAVASRRGWAAPLALPPASHGCVRVGLSLVRLLIGAATGAGLPALALTGGATASAVRGALCVAFAVCLLAGVPALARPRAAR